MIMFKRVHTVGCRNKTNVLETLLAQCVFTVDNSIYGIVTPLTAVAVDANVDGIVRL